MAVGRRRAPLARVVRLALLFSVPTWAGLIVLVLAGALGTAPALLMALAVVPALAALFRPLVADWARAAAVLRSDPGEPLPEATAEEDGRAAGALRFSEGAADVIGAAHALRRRAQQRMRRVEAAAAAQVALLDSLPEPVLLITPARVIERANAAADRLFGDPPAGRPLTGLLRDPGINDAVDLVLAGGGRQERQLTLSGPVERSFAVIVEPQAAPAERPQDHRAVVVLHDVTALVRAEQMRADFVANASHELRTPLTSVLGFIETLRGPARDDPEAHERFLAIMFQQASRMKRLIEDLLSLSRIELREHSPPTAAVDLADVVASVADGLEIQATDKDMRLEILTAADVPVVIGDEDELAQVLLNLLSNAIKYGRPGTPVSVRVESVARGPVSMPQATRINCVAVRVADQGEGIAKEHLPRLTERFYRVDAARSRQLGGTGLGLAIVKHIVNRHRGALVIESVVGTGTTVSVFLPAHRAGSAAAR